MPRHPRQQSAMSCAKMAEPVKILFGLCARVGSRNHVLDEGPDPAMQRSYFWVKEHTRACLMTLCNKLCKNGWTNRDNIFCGLGWVEGSMCYMGARWRNLANTSELCMCSIVQPYVTLLWPLVLLFLRAFNGTEWCIMCWWVVKKCWEIIAHSLTCSLDALPVGQPTVSKRWRELGIRCTFDQNCCLASESPFHICLFVQC